MTNGTDKQTAYAMKIKTEAMAGVRGYNADASARFAKFAAEKPERAGEAEQARANHGRWTAWLEDNDDARFWLDNQTTAQGLLKLARAACP